MTVSVSKPESKPEPKPDQVGSYLRAFRLFTTEGEDVSPQDFAAKAGISVTQHKYYLDAYRAAKQAFGEAKMLRPAPAPKPKKAPAAPAAPVSEAEPAPESTAEEAA